MTDQELRLVAEIIDRMHLNAAERQVEAVGRVRADSVTLSASYEQRIEALTKALQHERDANRRMSDEVIFQTNSHGKTMVERDGLLTQVQDLRAALAKEQELHAATALRLATEAAKLVERKKHPVKVGAYVKRLTGFNTTLAGEIGRVTRVDEDAAEIEYEVKRPNGETGVWCAKNCEPCDPPTADHDTPEGKAAAGSVIRDGRKTEPKPGDTVRLVRIPSRDVVSPELQTVLEWPWIERWGTLNQTAMVVEPRYQLDGAVSVCLSTNVYVRWPINCLEVVTEATHDTEAGKAVTAVALADVRKVTT